MNKYVDRVSSGLRIACGRFLGRRAMPPASRVRGSILKSDFERTRENVADLVFAAMDMQPVAGAGLEARLEDVAGATGLLARQLVGHG